MRKLESDFIFSIANLFILVVFQGWTLIQQWEVSSTVLVWHYNLKGEGSNIQGKLYYEMIIDLTL